MNKIYDKIKVMQEQLHPHLFTLAAVDFPQANTSIFKEIAKFDKDTCIMAFGDFGETLHNIAVDIDLAHPEVASGRFPAILNEDNAVLKLCQFIQVCQLAKQNNLTEIYSALSKSSKFVLPEIKTYLSCVNSRQQYVRLFESHEVRDSLRQQKSVQNIELDACFRRTVGLWDSISDFSEYVRFQNYYKSQIEKIKSRAEVYQKLGLDSMYNEIVGSVAEYEQMSNAQYLGFQRVPMTILAVILAKMHDCIIEMQDLDVKIKMPSSVFDGHDFYEDKTWRQVPFPEEFPPPHAFAIAAHGYCASAYPVNQLDVPSDEMVSILARLESMPELNGKPAFDHYFVVVPSIKLGMRHNYFYDFSNNKRFFHDAYVGRFDLDTILIREKKVVPVLAGEKDGKCYFICFWM